MQVEGLSLTPGQNFENAMFQLPCFTTIYNEQQCTFKHIDDANRCWEKYKKLQQMNDERGKVLQLGRVIL